MVQELIKSFENPNQKGRNNKTGLWQPHKSVEGGTDTLGYGHKLTDKEVKDQEITINGVSVSIKDGLTDQQVEDLLAQDTQTARDFVSNNFPNLNFNQNEAVTSLVFNTGRSRFKRSQAFKALKNNDLERFQFEAFDPKMGFVKGDGKVLKGLVNRRRDEQSLFNLFTPPPPQVKPDMSQQVNPVLGFAEGGEVDEEENEPQTIELAQASEQIPSQELFPPPPQEEPTTLFGPRRDIGELPGPSALFPRSPTDFSNVSRKEALTFAAGLGLRDTYNGVKQLLGIQEDKMAKDRVKLEALTEIYGNEVTAAFFGGAIVDPAGWLIPFAKARTVGKLALYGAGFGGAAGFLGYVPDTDADGNTMQDRLVNAGLSAGAGAVLVPGVGKGIEAAGKGLEKIGRKVSTEGAAAVSKEGTELGALFPKGPDPGDISELVKVHPQKTTIASPIQRFYTNTVGLPLKNFVFNNPGSFATGTLGAMIGSEAAPEEASGYEKLTNTAIGFMAGYVGAREVSTQFPKISDVLARGFIDNYGLPKDFVKMKRLAEIDESHIASRFVELSEEVKELDSTKRKILYNMLEGGEGGPEDLVQLNDDTRALITEIGQRMVDYGMLDPATFQKNVATYIHRSYTSKLTTKEGLGSKKIDEGVRKVRIMGNELRARGFIKRVSPKNLDKWRKAGWEVLGKDKTTGKVRIRKQLTKQERKAMGEIEDAGFAIARTGRLMSNDVATFKFYDDVANNYSVDNLESLARGVDTISATHPVLADRVLAGDEFIKVSKGKLQGTEINKWGNLEGKYIPESIYKDLERAENWRNFKNRPGVREVRSLNQWWKISKTAYNPVVHMNNLMSNVVLTDLADGDYRNVGRAGKIMFQSRFMNKEDPLYTLAKENGAFSADLFSAELAGLNKSLLKEYEVMNTIDEDKLLGLGAKITKNMAGRSLKATAKFLKGKERGFLPSDIYRAEDNIYRFGLFITRLEQGFSPEEAGAEATKWFINYNINAPFVNVLRETALPFVSYSYRVAPLLAESAILRPWKFAKWAALGYAMNNLGKDLTGGDEDKAQRALMADRDKGRFFNMPFFPQRMVKWPITINGKTQFHDFTRWVPGGDVFDQGDGLIPYLPSPLQPTGGMYGALISGLLGHDLFLDKPIPGLGLSATEDFKIKVQFIGKSLIPNFPGLPGAFSTERIKKAMKGVDNPFTDPVPVWQAIMQSLGIKVKPAEVETLGMQRAAEFGGKMSILRDEIFLKQSFRYASGAITLEEFQKVILDVRERAKQIILEDFPDKNKE
jgi:GH24 family phage-related lysozyme (muramidase)